MILDLRDILEAFIYKGSIWTRLVASETKVEYWLIGVEDRPE
jgi:hypothetical protein